MDGSRTLRDVVFSEPVGYRPLSLDLHLPRSSETPTPVVLFLHGGGWRAGSRRVFVPTMGDVVDPFDVVTTMGLAVVAADYRLSGEARYPAQLDDVRAALAWIRRHAVDHGLDAHRVVLWGESAGAAMAALIALDPDSDVAALIDWYGPADLTDAGVGDSYARDPSTREAQWLGSALADAPDLSREASPISHVHAGAPPTLIAHGLDDSAVPCSQSERFAEALRAAGVQVELDLIPGAGHMWTGDVDRDGILARAIDFALHASTTRRTP